MCMRQEKVGITLSLLSRVYLTIAGKGILSSTANLIVLIQTTTAAGSDPKGDPMDGWRGIHNYNIEYVSSLILERLGSLVDGIIPAFEMSYAMFKYFPAGDGVPF